MKIHKEGNRTILLVSSILVGINILMFILTKNWIAVSITGIISLSIWVFIVQFFRFPQFEILLDDNAIYAPADGKVVVIEKTHEPEYLKDNRIQISIFMSPTNVHVNWYPVNGKVAYSKYHAGKYLVAWHPKSSTENERTTVVVQERKSRESILVRQIAGAVARRVVCYAEEGSNVAQNQQLGFIKFGSRVDVFLPLTAKIEVNLNQIVSGGKTIIAKLK